MGFRSLRVINEDTVAAARGFGRHPHRDMEIVTYVLQGALEHKDSMGNSSVIRPGEVQRMTAGTGITHSERNPSETESVHLLQIWIMPEQSDLTPGYEQIAFPRDQKEGRLRLVASRNGEGGSVTIHQDSKIYDAALASGDSVTHQLGPGRGGWLQVISGNVSVNDLDLARGDGAAIENEAQVVIRAKESSDLLLFDLV